MREGMIDMRNMFVRAGKAVKGLEEKGVDLENSAIMIDIIKAVAGDKEWSKRILSIEDAWDPVNVIPDFLKKGIELPKIPIPSSREALETKINLKDVLLESMRDKVMNGLSNTEFIRSVAVKVVGETDLVGVQKFVEFLHGKIS